MCKQPGLCQVSSCALYIVNNSINQGMNILKKHDLDLDQFAIDLHFFQRSSARREDFKEVSIITNAASPYVLRHCQTRWLNIKKVLVRIIKQRSNL